MFSELFMYKHSKNFISLIKENRGQKENRKKHYEYILNILPDIDVSYEEFNEKYYLIKKIPTIIGEESQLEILEKSLNVNPIKSTKMFEEMNNRKSKTVDYEFCYEGFNKIYKCFCMMKTTDANKFSKTIGGGHQQNVKAEVIYTIELVRDKLLDNEIFIILLDGRFWKLNINTLSEYNTGKIIITSVDSITHDLIGQRLLNE